MPAHPDTPDPLRTALLSMEEAVQSTKSSLAYCAPEMQNEFWITLQLSLAGTLSDLYEKAKKK